MHTVEIAHVSLGPVIIYAEHSTGDHFLNTRHRMTNLCLGDTVEMSQGLLMYGMPPILGRADYLALQLQ